MDYRDDEPVADEEAEEEFEQVDADVAEAAEEVTEAQKAEAADLAKLLRAHPEIWIPYEEHVLQQLNPKAPGTGDDAPVAASAAAKNLTLSLRDLKTLDPKHSTYPFLTDYERTKCLSFRASQICSGANPYILVPEGVTDAYEIAKIELEAKRLPYILKRPMPDGSFEVWRLADLVVF